MENEEKKDIVMESEVVDEELKQEGGVVNDEATEPLVNEAMLNEMIEMGFPKARAMRGLFYGGQNIDSALNWIVEHENDPDINDPLPADAKPPPKKVLTEEEKASKAEELKKRIAENRRILAEQEKENELKRELDRIKSGREMADTRRKLQEQERQRAIDLRKKEKAEDIAHREQLRQLLRQDRINRFGIEKANELEERDRLKAEAAAAKKEERIEAERAKKEEERKQREAVAAGGPQQINLDEAVEHLKDALIRIDANPPEVRRVCLQTLNVYIGNVVDNPLEPKYRKIRTGNAAFQKRVVAADGGLDFLLAAGFARDIEPDFLVLSHSNMIFLIRARGDVQLYLSTSK